VDSVLDEGSLRIQYTYLPDGSRATEAPTTAGDTRFRGTYFDGLGRITGFASYASPGAGYAFNFEDVPDECHWNADGQLAVPCPLGPSLFFDGANIAGTRAANAWRLVTGPGIDFPLMGFERFVNTSNRAEVFYVTDGRGQQYVMADSTGLHRTTFDDPNTGYRGWQWAGGTGNAQTFGADRMNNGQVRPISFFRNRAYDQETGRYTQEDPIGVAGGLNLYQFNGNNPVAYTDPFGLCPKDKGGDGKTDKLDDCPRHSEGWKEHLKEEDAKAQRSECVARNTAWMKSDNALVAGVVGVGGSVAAIGGGLAAKAQGAQWVAQGSVELDLFFAAPKASSALVENGIASQVAGTAMMNRGAGLLKGGGVALATQATFGAAYVGTTIAMCQVNPDR
jgi:RHS repeat-associated protein